jgi:FkbM family methyltransferase
MPSAAYQRFLNRQSAFVDFVLLAKRIGFLKARSVYRALGRPSDLVSLRYPGFDHEIWLRSGTSDYKVFSEIFLHSEYAFDFRFEPKTIIDAGANIGLATLQLASRYPAAQIVAVEPDPANFEILVRNTSHLSLVTRLQAAIWWREESVKVANSHDEAWALQISEAGDAAGQQISGITIDAIQRQQGWATIDVLKLDIEGAEKAVLAHSSTWIDQVKMLIVETHDRLIPGSRRQVYAATSGFDEEWEAGEKLVFLRHPTSAVAPSNPPA